MLKLQNNYSVYILICPVEKCVRYVGITKQLLEDRLRGHLKDKRDNPHKRNWIIKLKEQNLKPIIKEVCNNLTQKQACKTEIDLISLYRYLVADKLTNLHEGGGIPPVQFGNKYRVGKRLSKEHKLKISESIKGEKNPAKQFGVGKKISIIKSRPVNQYNLDGNFIQRFYGISEAIRCTKVIHIHDCCSGKRKSAGGFKWRFDLLP